MVLMNDRRQFEDGETATPSGPPFGDWEAGPAGPNSPSRPAWGDWDADPEGLKGVMRTMAAFANKLETVDAAEALAEG